MVRSSPRQGRKWSGRPGRRARSEPGGFAGVPIASGRCGPPLPKDPAMTGYRRRGLLFLPMVAAALPFTALAQPTWWTNERRRADYEHWREAELRRREQAARREHREWRRDQWEEERERNAWARQQPWYRR